MVEKHKEDIEMHKLFLDDICCAFERLSKSVEENYQCSIFKRHMVMI